MANDLAFIIRQNDATRAVILNDEELAERWLEHLRRKDYERDNFWSSDTTYEEFCAIVHWHIERCPVTAEEPR